MNIMTKTNLIKQFVVYNKDKTVTESLVDFWVLNQITTALGVFMYDKTQPGSGVRAFEFIVSSAGQRFVLQSVWIVLICGLALFGFQKLITKYAFGKNYSDLHLEAIAISVVLCTWVTVIGIYGP